MDACRRWSTFYSGPPRLSATHFTLFYTGIWHQSFFTAILLYRGTPIYHSHSVSPIAHHLTYTVNRTFPIHRGSKGAVCPFFPILTHHFDLSAPFLYNYLPKHLGINFTFDHPLKHLRVKIVYQHHQNIGVPNFCIISC
jgi:hypothetical protein